MLQFEIILSVSESNDKGMFQIKTTKMILVNQRNKIKAKEMKRKNIIIINTFINKYKQKYVNQAGQHFIQAVSVAVLMILYPRSVNLYHITLGSISVRNDSEKN